MNPDDADQTRWLKKEVLPHGTALRSYLLGRFPTLADVDNLVQESVVRVLRDRERGEVASPKALLFAIGRNLAIDAVRRQQVVKFEPMTEIGASSVYTDETEVGESVSRKQELDLFAQAIQGLPQRCRQVMTLRAAFGLSQRQIAERLGISENTVEKHIGNGIRRCTEYFTRLGLP